VPVAVLNNSIELSDSRHHPNFGALASRISVQRPSSDDDTAVLQTLSAMEGIIRRSACHPIVQSAAAAAIASLPPDADRADRAAAVWAYIRDRVTFIQDDQIIAGAREVLIEPPRLLTMDDPEGDCDDFTMAVVALCNAAGVPARPVAVGADRAEPDRFSHVYAEAVMEDGSILALDASHGPYAGWSAPGVTKRVSWHTIQPSDCATPNPFNERFDPLLISLLLAAGMGIVMLIEGKH
jgi:hypothetical protein